MLKITISFVLGFFIATALIKLVPSIKEVVLTTESSDAIKITTTNNSEPAETSPTKDVETPTPSSNNKPVIKKGKLGGIKVVSTSELSAVPGKKYQFEDYYFSDGSLFRQSYFGQIMFDGPTQEGYFYHNSSGKLYKIVDRTNDVTSKLAQIDEQDCNSPNNSQKWSCKVFQETLELPITSYVDEKTYKTPTTLKASLVPFESFFPSNFNFLKISQTHNFLHSPNTTESKGIIINGNLSTNGILKGRLSFVSQSNFEGLSSPISFINKELSQGSCEFLSHYVCKVLK